MDTVRESSASGLSVTVSSRLESIPKQCHSCITVHNQFRNLLTHSGPQDGLLRRPHPGRLGLQAQAGRRRRARHIDAEAEGRQQDVLKQEAGRQPGARPLPRADELLAAVPVGEGAGDRRADQRAQAQPVLPAADGVLDAQAADPQRGAAHSPPAGRRHSMA